MPFAAIISFFTGGLPFGGAIVAGLLLAGGAFWTVESGRIAERDSQIASLHCNIDGPTETPPCKTTGYIVLVGRSNAATAQVRDNLKTCQAAVDADKAKIDALGVEAADRKRQTAAALVDLNASQKSADQLAAAVASLKPTANACVDADNIVLELAR